MRHGYVSILVDALTVGAPVRNPRQGDLNKITFPEGVIEIIGAPCRRLSHFI
jgi:hypothetical protein